LALRLKNALGDEEVEVGLDQLLGSGDGIVEGAPRCQPGPSPIRRFDGGLDLGEALDDSLEFLGCRRLRTVAQMRDDVVELLDPLAERCGHRRRGRFLGFRCRRQARARLASESLPALAAEVGFSLIGR
jgi:hypothetical protein